MPEEQTASIPELLSCLDDVIASKSTYQAARSAQADSLKAIAQLSSGQPRIDALHQLYDTYLHFHTDSVLSTLQWIMSLPEYTTDTQLHQYVRLCQSEVFGMTGFYIQANNTMMSVRPEITDDSTLLHYYNARHSVLGWMSEYAEAILPDFSSEIHQRAALFHDSILVLEPDELNRSIVRSNRDYDKGNYRQCIDTLLNVLEKSDPARQIFAYSRLSEAYGKLGIKDQELRYLILTAIGDLRSGITEYMALPRLASLLYERGDTERAYNYMFCALEDANLCKASLRTIEVTQFFPIINQSHHEHLNRQRWLSYTLILLLTLFVAVLAVATVILWRMNRKLNQTRALLAKANNDLKKSYVQLKQANGELLKTDKIKEEYLTSYLTRSRRYLASTESLQHQYLKLLQTRQLDELQKLLKSTQMLDDEQTRFYEDFDETFLHLYPNFVEKFNQLLKPDCQIIPKKGELLTTELRIFALIRMGETDSTKIAKFLNYSLTTIYNYRSRIRNNALCDKDLFEQKVIEL